MEESDKEMGDKREVMREVSLLFWECKIRFHGGTRNVKLDFGI